MNDDDIAQMDELGITSTTESIYHYKRHKYSKLSDAVRFAKTDTFQETGRQEPLVADSPKSTV